MFDLGGSAYAIPILSIIYHHRERISLTDAKKKKTKKIRGVIQAGGSKLKRKKRGARMKEGERKRTDGGGMRTE